MNVVVRRATAADLDAVVPLFDAYRQFYGKAADLELARRFLSDRLALGDSVVLIAERPGGGAVGFVQLYPSFSSVRAAPIYILSDLFVVPEARKHGVGSLLLKSAADSARDHRGLGERPASARRYTLGTSRESVEGEGDSVHESFPA